MLLTFLLLAAQNLVVNGDFETNTSSGCDYNNSNAGFSAKMTGCAGYGPSSEIDIMDSGACYGPAGPVGATKVAIACNGDPNNDAFTMALTGPLTVGTSYTLKVHLYAHIESWSPGQLPVQFGLATAAGTQGTVVATLTPATGSFTQLAATFTAPVAATYLSVAALINSVDGWTHVDGVELTGGGFTLSKSGACNGVVTWTTSGGSSSGGVALIFGNAGVKTKPGGVCAGTTVQISNPKKVVIMANNGVGAASYTGSFGASFCGKTFQAVNIPTCDVSNTVVL